MLDHILYATGLKKEPLSHKVSSRVKAASELLVSVFDTSDRDAKKAHASRISESATELEEIELLKSRIELREIKEKIADYRTPYGIRRELEVRAEFLSRQISRLEGRKK